VETLFPRMLISLPANPYCVTTQKRDIDYKRMEGIHYLRIVFLCNLSHCYVLASFSCFVLLFPGFFEFLSFQFRFFIPSFHVSFLSFLAHHKSEKRKLKMI
jgi:hypothetical protein